MQSFNKEQFIERMNEDMKERYEKADAYDALYLAVKGINGDNLGKKAAEIMETALEEAMGGVATVEFRKAFTKRQSESEDFFIFFDYGKKQKKVYDERMGMRPTFRVYCKVDNSMEQPKVTKKEAALAALKEEAKRARKEALEYAESANGYEKYHEMYEKAKKRIRECKEEIVRLKEEYEASVPMPFMFHHDFI